MIGISDEKLTDIHGKVYRKNGYTFQTGLKAFMRGRRWAKHNERTAKPPAGIANKLLMWAEINKSIKIEMIRQKEELKNAEQPETIKADAGSPATKVSEEPSGD